MTTDSPDPRIAARLDHAQLTRSLQMLMGLVTGITADGELNDQEIAHLRLWLRQHPELATTWPGSAIWNWVDDALGDGFVSEADRSLLLRNLSVLVANDFMQTGSTAPEVSPVPVDDDCIVEHAGAVLVLTGTFQFGTRSACQQLAERAGSIVAGSVTRKTDVLVIGSHVTSSWVTESFGRKIQAAMDLRSGGHPIAIISENRWLEDLRRFVES